MPVIGTESSTACPLSPPVCSDISYLTPSLNYHEGCPIFSKLRHIVIPKGTGGIVKWPLLRPDGKSADLSSCFSSSVTDSASSSTSVSVSVSNPEESTIKTRFANCDKSNCMEIEGAADNPAMGTVLFAIPAQVYTVAGIYYMDIAVVTTVAGVETPIFIESALLSVEDSLWGNTTQVTGPPTLADIRTVLQDSPVENELLLDYEFDIAEILSAIVRPIQQWNETPPPIARHNCATFPYKYHWLQGVAGQLLLTAAHGYMRNNLKVNHAGVQGNFKDKHQEYLQVAQAYIREWTEFITMKKVEINIAGACGSLPSAYSGRGY